MSEIDDDFVVEVYIGENSIRANNPWMRDETYKNLSEIKNKVLKKTASLPKRNQVDHLEPIPLFWCRFLDPTILGAFISSRYLPDFFKGKNVPPDPCIVVNRNLDESWVPDYVIERILFHESIHFSIIGHGRRFREWESWYPEYEKAFDWEKDYSDKVIFNRDFLKRGFEWLTKGISPDSVPHLMNQFGNKFELLGAFPAVGKITYPDPIVLYNEDIGYQLLDWKSFTDFTGVKKKNKRKNPIINFGPPITKEDIFLADLQQNWG